MAAACKHKPDALLIFARKKWTGRVPAGALPVHIFLVGHGKLVLFFLRLASFKGLFRQRGAGSVRMEDGDTLL